MSKPSRKKAIKKAKATRAKEVRIANAQRQEKIRRTKIEARYSDLLLRHNPIRPHDLRVCGDCQICCYVMKIEETDSLKYEKCKHQCSSGCGIHQNPPDECKHFDCTWKLEKLLGNEYRPDRCGFMMYAQRSEVFGRLILLALESYEGAWQEPGIYAKLAYVAHKLNMLIIYLDNENNSLGMYGPSAILKHAHKIIENLQEKEK